MVYNATVNNIQLYHGINGNVIVVDMKYPYDIYIPACKNGDHGLSGE